MFQSHEVERMLEVELTKEELAEKSDEMSLAVVDRIRLKAKAKSAAEGFTAEIKLADQNIETLALLLQEKKEFRKVRCIEQEAEGQIETMRADTGEIISVRDMTPLERQGQFAFGNDAADSQDDDQQLAESMANAAAFLPDANIEEPGAGTPTNTERMATEIDGWAKSVIKDGQRIKRIYVDGNPYVVLAQNGTPTQSVNEVHAVPVLPISIAGENSTKISFNCGTPRKPDIWIEAGEVTLFTIKQTAKAEPIEDDFTAPQCSECGRIEGAHAENCAHASKFSYKTYLEFATAQKLKNPKSHARSMELKRDRDEEVRAWLETEQGSPADGKLFQKEPEPKRRRKSRQTENSYEEGA